MSVKSKIKQYIPDSVILKYDYKKVFGRELDLKHPKTLNEKLQWLKLNNRNPFYSKLVDKYEVKNIVASKIGAQYIVPTIGVYNKFADIDFSTFPQCFVLKCTHDSGSTIVCKDKNNFDFDYANKKLTDCLAMNFYYRIGREWPYKNVKPRILAENFISDTPNDYKFYMFNGEMDSVMVCTDRDKGHPRFRFYDKDWNRLIYMHQDLEPEDDVSKPQNFSKMVKIAECLSAGFPHIRVDLYNVKGKIYFGELTFYNQSGFDTDITYETDLKWGKMTDLSMVKRGR